LRSFRLKCDRLRVEIDNGGRLWAEIGNGGRLRAKYGNITSEFA
jgi:hypothetical protein